MKKIFTNLRSKKAFMVIAFALASCSSMYANNAYYDHYALLGTYPTGVGKVYAQISSDCTKMDGVDFETPAESVEVQFIFKALGENKTFTAVAVPEDGWIVAGFTYGEKNEDGTFTCVTDTLTYSSNPAEINSVSTISDKDSLTAVSIFPLEPDEAFYAVFTHVAPRVVNGYGEFGEVKIDKISNNIGDQVTLTAIPKRDGTFSHWIEKSTGNKITDNPLTVTVTKAEEYIAYFENDLMIKLNFPEEGGYLPFYDAEYRTEFPSEREFDVLDFDARNVSTFKNNGQDAIAVVPTKSGVVGNWAQSPVIFYGKGEHVALRDTSSTTPGNNEYNLLRWSGDEGVKTDTLRSGHHYYTFDAQKAVFNIVKSDVPTIAAKQIYMAMPDSCVEALTPGNFPDIIYTSEEESGETGISAVTTAAKAKKNGIYTIDGRRVEALEQEGIYIFDGKKVLYRKRK